MNKTIFLAVLISFSMCTCKSQKTDSMIDTETITKLDLEKYMGTWYEIARYPNSFEKDLVGVTATYTLRNNGKIDVLNQGYLSTLDGKLSQSKGKAKVPNPDEPGKLKVAFFLFFYGDYYILELDEKDYQWAMIGSSTPKFFWILSRSPEMPDELYQKLLKNAERRGYDISKIIKVPQPAPKNSAP